VGQRARIHARALYRDADILVADAPLSAVDAGVGRQIFNEAIMELALKRGKCVILATHQHQHIVDFRCVLVNHGRIICTGSYEACVESSHGTLTHQIPDDSEVSNFSRLDAVVANRKENRKTLVSKSFIASRRLSTGAGIEEGDIKADKENKEMNSQGFVSSETFFDYLRAMGGIYVGFVLFVMYSLTQSAVLLTLTTVGRWAERPQSDQDDWDIYGLILGLGSFVVVFAFFRAFLSFFLVIKASQVLHDRMAEAVLRAKTEFYDTNPLGEDADFPVRTLFVVCTLSLFRAFLLGYSTYSTSFSTFLSIADVSSNDDLTP
jgi:ATP-binding cassette subfamily C (CFTR/MRP) protein 4